MLSTLKKFQASFYHPYKYYGKLYYLHGKDEQYHVTLTNVDERIVSKHYFSEVWDEIYSKLSMVQVLREFIWILGRLRSVTLISSIQLLYYSNTYSM